MFYDKLNSLCAERGISVTELMKILDVSPSSATRWKNKGYSPAPETAKKIADYFGVTVKELTDVGQKEKPAIENDDRLNDMKRLLIEQVKQLDDSQVAALSRIADEILRLRGK